MAILAAILSSAVVELYLTAILANDPTPPFPSLADVGYLAFYPLAAIGIPAEASTPATALQLADVRM